MLGHSTLMFLCNKIFKFELLELGQRTAWIREKANCTGGGGGGGGGKWFKKGLLSMVLMVDLFLFGILIKKVPMKNHSRFMSTNQHANSSPTLPKHPFTIMIQLKVSF